MLIHTERLVSECIDLAIKGEGVFPHSGQVYTRRTKEYTRVTLELRKCMKELRVYESGVFIFGATYDSSTHDISFTGSYDNQTTLLVEKRFRDLDMLVQMGVIEIPEQPRSKSLSNLMYGFHDEFHHLLKDISGKLPKPKQYVWKADFQILHDLLDDLKRVKSHGILYVYSRKSENLTILRKCVKNREAIQYPLLLRYIHPHIDNVALQIKPHMGYCPVPIWCVKM